MEMTEEQIVSKYLRNDRQPSQIAILAQLNGTSQDKIIEILQRHDAIRKKGSKYNPSKEVIKRIIQLREEGTSLRKISALVGFPESLVKRLLAQEKEAEDRNILIEALKHVSYEMTSNIESIESQLVELKKARIEIDNLIQSLLADTSS